VVRVHPERAHSEPPDRRFTVTDDEVWRPGRRDAYWFVGGPLDGRVQTRPAAAEPMPSCIRYVHLHDGPKIVHYYDLTEVAGHGGEYRLRTD
jgi:hypothetical protein